MLEALVVLLIILWALGFFGPWHALALGGFIHILLVIAVVVILFRIIAGRRPVV